MPTKKDVELKGCRRTVAVGHSASQLSIVSNIGSSICELNLLITLASAKMNNFMK